MNIHSQKEFINDIMSMGKSFKSSEHQDFYFSTVSDFSSETFKTLGISGSIKDFDIDSMFKTCEEQGVEPIEIIDWAFDMLSKCPTINTGGQEIDMSSSNDILQDLKSKFSGHQDSQDINKF